MKRILLLFLLVSGHLLAQVQNVNFDVSPNPFQEDEQITITVSNINPTIWGVSDIYLWGWSSAGGVEQDAVNNGTWNSSKEEHKLTNNGNGTYSISFVPTAFYGRTGLESIGFLVKAEDGTGDKKSQDAVYVVGSVEVPPVTEAPVPAGMLDGINYNESDPTRATLVLYAPMKQFVYLLGDFNNWEKNENYLLKKDSAKEKFWIELTGLTPQADHLFQYLVDGTIRIADPYSTTILDEFNDTSIDEVTYPNLPAYPSGKTSHAVTLLKTGMPDYNWKVNNFQGPEKTDLVIYELLIRDFDALHSFDAVKARLDYLQDLGVNAIELMPVNEFDGNESWGYNPSFHMALDKYYGTAEALKGLVDECHARGIAVILDVVYNHATGQNPYYRLWNTSNGGYGGQASADSPFFNPVAKHSYSVFNDFNHSTQATRDYVKRVTQYWIEEFHVDGFRWDLTKGFTQNCSESNGSCTDSFQADRVAVLKQYADYQWEKSTGFYVIFEHLGTNQEETEWVNYRLSEGKGIMVWSNLNGPYNETTMGYHGQGQSNFGWISYKNRGWSVPANISYMESHDEERLMYKNLTFGNTSGSYSVKDLSTALKRQEAAGAFYFTVPGPKMIWQFGELGYEVPINDPCRVCNKPIRWEYLDDPARKAIYDQWAKLIKLKKQEPIFHTADFTVDAASTNGLKKIQLTDPSSNPELKHVNVIGNFGVTTQQIDPDFQETGIWYDLLNDNQSLSVTNTNNPITLAPGEFRVYGSSQVALPVEEFVLFDAELLVYPNPSSGGFRLNKEVEKLEIYDYTGRLLRVYKGDLVPERNYSTEGLKPSLYMLKISTEFGTASRRLIVE